MSIEKIEEFAESGEKHLNNLDVKQGFQQAEKPERQWFNYLLNDFSKKINQVIDGLSDIDFEFDGFAPKISELESNYTEISSELTRVSDDFKSADAVLQGQIDGIGGGKFAYTTYAKMVAAAALPEGDPLKLPANSSVDVTNDSDANKNATYAYDGTTFTKSAYDLETLVRNKVINSFSTLAKMQTDGTSLADGTLAQVYNEITNNGLYVKASGAWVKSEYDPTGLANSYTDNVAITTLETAAIDATNKANAVDGKVSKIKTQVFDNSVSRLDEAQDANGDVYRYTDKDGGLFVTGLDRSGSIQDNINLLNAAGSSGLPTNKNKNLVDFEDAVGSNFGYIDSNSSLHLANEIYINEKPLSQDLETLRYQNILMHRYPKGNEIFPVAVRGEIGTPDRPTKRMLFGIKTPTGLVCFFHQQMAGGDGDTSGAELWKAIITINDDLSMVVESKEVWKQPDDPLGIVKHPMLGRTSDGRIILIYEEGSSRDFYVKYQCYSSDEGLTFSAPQLLVKTNDEPKGDTLVTALGTTGEITTTPTGRLILPSYSSARRCYCAYSDDDGATWTYSDYARGLPEVFEPCITLDMNDDLIMDCRPSAATYKRQRAISYDNGETWNKLVTVDQIPSSTNQGVLFRDKSTNIMLQTHNETTSIFRDHFRLSVSFDNVQTFPYVYKPYIDSFYVGYTQIIKWKEGVYLLLMEYADRYVDTNYNESVGIVTLTLNEVMSNVHRN